MFKRCIGRENHDRDILTCTVSLPDTPERLDSVHSGHHMIHKDHIIRGFLYHFKTGFSTVRLFYLHAGTLQKFYKHPSVDLVIIHHQYACFRRLKHLAVLMFHTGMLQCMPDLSDRSAVRYPLS